MAELGLFSAIGSIFGGNSQKRAAERAGKYQIQAAQMGVDELRRQFDQTRSDYAPYQEAGVDALRRMQRLLGAGSLEGQNAQIQLDEIAALRNSPFYQSLFNAGNEAILQNAAATGGIRGGNTQGALADFGRDTLAQTIQQQLGNLSGLAGMGMGATGSVAGLGANTAQGVASLFGQQGAARAGTALTKGGIDAGIFNNIGNLLDGGEAKKALSFLGKLF